MYIYLYVYICTYVYISSPRVAKTDGQGGEATPVVVSGSSVMGHESWVMSHKS